MSEEKDIAMCGFCCDICKAYNTNIAEKDERKQLAKMWKKYYQMDVSPDHIACDGCRCEKENAVRYDKTCPIRPCVLEKGIEHCGMCRDFPCKLFLERKGLSKGTAMERLGERFDAQEYEKYLLAYDNLTRLREINIKKK